MRTQRLSNIRKNITFNLLYYHFLNLVFALSVIWLASNIDFKVVSGWLLPNWHFNLVPVVILVIVITIFRQSLSYFAFAGVEEPKRVLGMSISEFHDLLKQISNALGLKRQQFKVTHIDFENVAVVDRPITPKDLILVPKDTPPEITQEELQALISHEIGHVKAHVGIQHVFQELSVSSIIAFMVKIYIAGFWRAFSEMPLIFSIIWLIPLTIAIRPIVNKVLNPIASFLTMRISHLNEHYADLIALSVSGPMASINMLIHLQDWAYKKWRLSILAKLFIEILKAKGGDENLINKCKSWIEKTQYVSAVPPHEHEKEMVLNFVRIFGTEIGLSPADLPETEPLGRLIRNLLRLVPVYKRIAIRETFVRLWKWDKYVPTWRQFDKQAPFGILDSEELDDFVKAIEDLGIEGVNPVDLTTLSHPTILKRIEFILSLSRS